MKIVIDIPEDIYQKIKETSMVIKGRNGKRIDNILFNAVINGTPLPKGHGRLIDADKLMELCLNSASRTIDCNDIARFPTIIESYRTDTTRDCKTCGHSNDGKCAGTEECHECMWVNKYNPIKL